MKLNIKMACIVMMLALMLIAPAFASTTPVLSVMDYKVVPSATVTALSTTAPLMPGDSGTIVVKIINTLQTAGAGNQTTTSSSVTNTYYLNNQPGKVESSSTSTISSDASSGAANIKFVNLIADGPIKVQNQPYVDVGYLGPGDSVQFEFTIKADDGATDGKYFLMLKVKTDYDGAYINQAIPVVIDSTPIKMVLNDAPAVLGTGKNNIVIDVVNYRPNGVTSASVVPTGDQFVFKPRQEYTVGNIGSGEMYTVSFDTAIKNGTYNSSPSFVVRYKNGDNWHESAPLTVHLEPKTSAVVAQSGDSNGILYLFGAILVLVVLVGGIFLYMKSKRSKK